MIGYPTPGKQKARLILEAFCAGAGGKVADPIPDELLPGPAAFYGVTPATKHLWDQARREGRDWVYIDNAYFDVCRGTYYRVTKNRLQHSGVGKSNGLRLKRLPVDIKPWKKTGSYLILAPQSDEFMKVCAEYPGSWINDTLAQLRKVTTRTIDVRVWNRDKVQAYKDLRRLLPQCWAVVTYSSASAITAMLEGVPAFVTAEDCIAKVIANTDLSKIERPEYSERLEWAQVVADNQWTLEEMRSGLCWSML